MTELEMGLAKLRTLREIEQQALRFPDNTLRSDRSPLEDLGIGNLGMSFEGNSFVQFMLLLERQEIIQISFIQALPLETNEGWAYREDGFLMGDEQNQEVSFGSVNLQFLTAFRSSLEHEIARLEINNDPEIYNTLELVHEYGGFSYYNDSSFRYNDILIEGLPNHLKKFLEVFIDHEGSLVNYTDIRGSARTPGNEELSDLTIAKLVSALRVFLRDILEISTSRDPLPREGSGRWRLVTEF